MIVSIAALANILILNGFSSYNVTSLKLLHPSNVDLPAIRSLTKSTFVNAVLANALTPIVTTFDKSLPNRRLLGRIEGSKLIPYHTRAEIEQKIIDAPVILWGNDAVDIYLMQIQGSAIALLDDGSSVRIKYADNNGHNFVGIGSILLKKGLLKPGQASMDKIRDWLKENPQIAKANMSENPRYIFHAFSDAEGPIGALGVPLVAGRSLAVDETNIPLGALLWLETTGPNKEKIEKLVIAQDIGGAIKGIVRGDYFWGHGEQALLSAGKMNSTGQYYILLPKAD